MISFLKLFELLNDRGISKNWLRDKVGRTLVSNILKGKNVNTSTVAKVCAALNCQPGDIMEFIPEEDQQNG